MKSIVLIFSLLYSVVYASEMSFEAFRSSERTMVLKAFKKLYKKRQHIHQNYVQNLKHHRSRTLKRDSLHKSTLHSLEDESAQKEPSQVFFQAYDPCESGCKHQEVSQDNELIDGSGISGGTPESAEDSLLPESTPEVIEPVQNSDEIRLPTSNVWGRR